MKIPIVELLLQRGADPRFGGHAMDGLKPQFLFSAIEEAGVNMTCPTSDTTEDVEEVRALNAEATSLMKAKADELDRKLSTSPGSHWEIQADSHNKGQEASHKKGKGCLVS